MKHKSRGLDILNFIDPCYFTESYRAIYEMRRWHRRWLQRCDVLAAVGVVGIVISRRK
ncbi:hypothetical protein QJS10_CPA08g01321 [Acorus calamus]|uniref:Uncharacterized protein n=1 Tax=Acorus calamus TaxID=4465 RepID=A0AAV9EAL9_ACOCL|nr:hypothetical protein QJS10_CPA08g01321 [Acorus calamus]